MESYQEIVAMVVEVPNVYQVDEELGWCRDDIHVIEIPFELALPVILNNNLFNDKETTETEYTNDLFEDEVYESVSSDATNPEMYEEMFDEEVGSDDASNEEAFDD